MTENPSDKFRTMGGASPEEAKFFWTGGPVELAERTWFVSRLSGVTAFETDEGLLLVDSGTAYFGPGLSDLIRRETDVPVHTAVFTHGHVDHAYGLPAFLVEGQDLPRVVGHAAMPARFDRYERTAGHNRSINARQFGGAVDNETGVPFDRPAIAPDVLYDDELMLTVGGVEFELRHCRGETDDHTWVHCPERGVLCPGDLVIWGVPNAGNPQKVQRYPWDWAAGLRAMAEVGARSMGPGHGGPIVDDPATIRRLLTETADLLDAIVDQALALLEDGSPPHVDIVRGIGYPSSDSPWLQPVYDEAEFIARNVIRYFGGWYSGRPSELKPAPRPSVAQAVAAAAGGSRALLDRARRHSESGDLATACHLADYALEADPGDEAVQVGVADLYDERAEAETGLMAANLYRSAAAYARDGRPFA